MDLKICRICLDRKGTISIFTVEDNIQHSTRVMRCVNVEVVEGDGLPDCICETCASELLTCYEFVNKCEASDKALRSVNYFTNDIKDQITAVKVELENDDNDEKDDDIKDIDDVKDYVDERGFKLVDDLKSENSDNHNFPDNFSDTFDHCKVKPKRKYTKRIKDGEIDRRKLKRKMAPLKCGICGLKVSSRSAMEGHMRTHTGEKPFACHVCEARFNLKGSLKRHLLTHTHLSEREKKFICETCGNSFISKGGIIAHLRIHTDEKPYLCPQCPKRFRQTGSLIRHKRSHTGEKPYTCPTCFKRFSEKARMKEHLEYVHSEAKNFSCHLCNKSVKTKNALYLHMKIHTNETHNVCSYCGMTFSFKGNLQTHIRRMHSEKSGNCNICKKIFGDLEGHMRKHTGEKPFICEMCSQGFTSKRSLSNHMSFKHNNAAKFKCSIGECSRTFPTGSMLEFHLLKQHTNHTPYVCHHCSRGFFRTSDLSRHLRMIHMDASVRTTTRKSTV